MYIYIFKVLNATLDSWFMKNFLYTRQFLPLTSYKHFLANNYNVLTLKENIIIEFRNTAIINNKNLSKRLLNI